MKIYNEINKQVRKEIGIKKYEKRLANNGINAQVVQKIIDRGGKANFFAYKTTGKPCSCRSCSPRKEIELWKS